MKHRALISLFQLHSSIDKVMFSHLRNFLILGGIFKSERQTSLLANLRQFLTVFIAVITMGSYVIGGFVYSFKYQDVVNTVKLASYSYNNICSVCLTYLYIIFNRNKLKQLLDAWDLAIHNS